MIFWNYLVAYKKYPSDLFLMVLIFELKEGFVYSKLSSVGSDASSMLNNLFIGIFL